MTTLYHRLRMRYGLLVCTGKGVDWNFVTKVLLIACLYVATVECLHLHYDNKHLQSELDAARVKIDVTNARIASCLNGGPVGFTREKGKNLWVSCAKPTLIEVDET